MLSLKLLCKLVLNFSSSAFHLIDLGTNIVLQISFSRLHLFDFFILIIDRVLVVDATTSLIFGGV